MKEIDVSIAFQRQRSGKTALPWKWILFTQYYQLMSMTDVTFDQRL